MFKKQAVEQIFIKPKSADLCNLSLSSISAGSLSSYFYTLGSFLLFALVITPQAMRSPQLPEDR
jgi:hypothetical protein